MPTSGVQDGEVSNKVSKTGIYQRDELTTKVYYIALDGETTNLNEFTNFCGVLLLIQQFVNSIKFVVLSPLRYESGRAERPRLSVIIIFVVSLIRLTAKLQFTAAKANIGGGCFETLIIHSEVPERDDDSMPRLDIVFYDTSIFHIL